MKRVRIAKYTKEKHKAAVEKAKAERKARKYGLWDNIKYVISESWKADKKAVIMIFAGLIFINAADFAGLFCDKFAVDLVLNEDNRLVTGCVLLLLIFDKELSMYLYDVAGVYRGWVGYRKVSGHIQMKLLRKYTYTDYENTEKTDVNDKLQKAVTATDQVFFQMLYNMREMLGKILALFALGGIFAYLNPFMILIVAIPSYLDYKIERHKNMWIWNMADNWQNYDRQIRYINNSSADTKYAKDVRIFNLPHFFKQTMDRSLGKRLEWTEQEDEWTFRHRIPSSIIIYLGYMLSYGYIIYRAFTGSIGAGDFVLYFNAILLLSNTVYNLVDNYSGFRWQSDNVSYTREYCEIAENTNRGKGEPIPTDDYEIKFRNVSYTYYKADEPTIKNLSFTLRKGERLALVGLNGAGKTTLIKLMCGLYDPTEGEILLNGKPVNAYNRDEYFTLFSAVFQDIDELPVSIAENISGVTYEQTDKEKLTRCMKQAGLYDKIDSLPNKEKTHLDRSLYDDAIELSGGQKQKMALAKALYKNAPILLLDEPTAALDPIAEQEMYLQYADFSKSKASVFISHRLASTRFCDRIILLDNGEIAEIGTHSELMAMKGKYAELYDIQSSYYNEGVVNPYEGENDDTQCV